VCETGGGRRAWLRGQTNVSKMHTLRCAAYNLGLLLRKVWGLCKPRNAEAAGAALFFVFLTLLILAAPRIDQATDRIWIWLSGICGLLLVWLLTNRTVRFIRTCQKKYHSLTGC
jgi:hypothetical protein